MKTTLSFLLLFVSCYVFIPTVAEAVEFDGAVEFNFGAIPLFNVNDGTFTKGDPALGVTPSLEFKITDNIQLGVEVMFVWIKSINAKNPRFIMSPHVRGTLSFPLIKELILDIILAGGATIWPEDTKTDMGLGEDLSATRAGWSARVALGLTYEFSDDMGVYLTGGYYISNSHGKDINVICDMLLISLGLRMTF